MSAGHGIPPGRAVWIGFIVQWLGKDSLSLFPDAETGCQRRGDMTGLGHMLVGTKAGIWGQRSDP